MNINPIHTNQDYQNALIRIEQLMDACSGTKEGDELEILSALVSIYENKHFPIENPDPIEALKFRMEQGSLTNRDIEKVLMSRQGRVSEILNRRRKLSLSMIRRLHTQLHIPTDILIQDYALVRKKRLKP